MALQKTRIFTFMLLIFSITSIFSMTTLATDNNKETTSDFTLQALDGSSITLSDLKGTPVIFTFSATWCGPCKVLMADLDQLQRQYGDKVKILMISNESESKLNSYISSKNYNFDVLLDSNRKVSNAYNVSGIPNWYILDSEGNIAYHKTGYASYYKTKLQETVDSLIDTTPEEKNSISLRATNLDNKIVLSYLVDGPHSADIRTFDIYRRVSNENEYQKIYRSKHSEYSYSDADIQNGVEYCYKVKHSQDWVNLESNEVCVTASKVQEEKNTLYLEAKNINKGVELKVLCEGNTCSDYGWITISRRESTENQFEIIYSNDFMGEDLFIDDTATNGKEYYYKSEVGIYNSESRVESNTVSLQYEQKNPAAKISLQAKNINKGIELNFECDGDLCENIFLYGIYKKTSKGKYRYLGYLRGNNPSTYLDSKVNANMVYQYKVIAYRKSSLGLHKIISNEVSITCEKEALKIQITTKNIAKGIELEIKSEGDTNNSLKVYYIYRKSSKGNYKFIDYVWKSDVNKFLDSSVTSGEEYCYTILALDSLNGIWKFSNEVCTSYENKPQKIVLF